MTDIYKNPYGFTVLITVTDMRDGLTTICLTAEEFHTFVAECVAMIPVPEEKEKEVPDPQDRWDGWPDRP